MKLIVFIFVCVFRSAAYKHSVVQQMQQVLDETRMVMKELKREGLWNCHLISYIYDFGMYMKDSSKGLVIFTPVEGGWTRGKGVKNIWRP